MYIYLKFGLKLKFIITKTF